MYLRTLNLRYFRSYTSCALTLPDGPVIVVGHNGAGKTNILEAISLLAPGRGLRRAKTSEFSKQPENLGWKITTKFSNDQLIETGVNMQHSNPQRTLKIDETPARMSDLGEILRLIWLTPAMDRLWTEDATGRRQFLDRMTQSFFPDHAQHAAAYEKARRSRNLLLREPQLDTRWCQALEAEMAGNADTITQARQQTLERIQMAQANTPTTFPAADLMLETATPENLRDFWATTRNRDHAAGRTLVGPHRSDLQAIYRAKGVPAAMCSTGEQKALLMSIVLANVRALIDYDNVKPLVLLDEVAAHFDPVRRGELFDEICHLDVQAWMTGTEEAMFRDMHARGQIIYIDDADGISYAS